jgi:hypothetical protein
MSAPIVVKVLLVDQEGNEHFERYSALRDCFPDDDQDADYVAAVNEIDRQGRAWVGGGAAPLFLLIRAGGAS